MRTQHTMQAAPQHNRKSSRGEASAGAARPTAATSSRLEVMRGAGGNLAAHFERKEAGGDDEGRRDGDGAAAAAPAPAAAAAPVFPTAAKIKGMATVIGYCLAEWAQTKADATATQRRERGFWIRWNRKTDAYTKTASVTGSWRTNDQGASVDIGSRPADSGDEFTVASFHCHTPTFYRSATDVGAGRPTGPSQSDYDWDGKDDVAGLVFDYAIGVAPAGHPLHSNAVIYSAGTQRSA